MFSLRLGPSILSKDSYIVSALPFLTLTLKHFLLLFFVYHYLLQSTRFHFDGERVKGSDTAASLGMAEGDTIEAFLVRIHS